MNGNSSCRLHVDEKCSNCNNCAGIKSAVTQTMFMQIKRIRNCNRRLHVDEKCNNCNSYADIKSAATGRHTELKQGK